MLEIKSNNKKIMESTTLFFLKDGILIFTAELHKTCTKFQFSNIISQINETLCY